MCIELDISRDAAHEYLKLCFEEGDTDLLEFEDDCHVISLTYNKETKKFKLTKYDTKSGVSDSQEIETIPDSLLIKFLKASVVINIKDDKKEG